MCESMTHFSTETPDPRRRAIHRATVPQPPQPPPPTTHHHHHRPQPPKEPQLPLPAQDQIFRCNTHTQQGSGWGNSPQHATFQDNSMQQSDRWDWFKLTVSPIQLAGHSGRLCGGGDMRPKCVARVPDNAVFATVGSGGAAATASRFETARWEFRTARSPSSP